MKALIDQHRDAYGVEPMCKAWPIAPFNGLYTAEVIHRQSWNNLDAVEEATLAWGDGFNQRGRLEPIGYTCRGRGRLLP